MGDLRPGNPLRVVCRTCGAQVGQPCLYPRDARERVVSEFHKRRCKDGYRDFVASPRVPKSPKSRNRNAHPSRPHLPIATLGDLPQVERVVSEASRTALDIQTPQFWRSVWDDEDTSTTTTTPATQGEGL